MTILLALSPDALVMLFILAFVGLCTAMFWEFELRRQRHIERDWQERRLHRGR